MDARLIFYPATCHPPVLTRRQVLVGGALLAAGSSLAPVLADAAADGTGIVRRYASAPEDPWVVCHGIRAMGHTFTMKGGRRAVDWLLETQLALLAANGTTVLGFPPAVEAHPNMFLKTMLEAGVSLDYGFTHQGRRRTLRELVSGAQALFRPSEVTGQPNMLPWSLIALTRTLSPMRARWTNAWGETVDLDAAVENALHLLEQASMPLMQAMREDRPETTKAPVHGFTCGGTHMIYALLTAVHGGYIGHDRRERLGRQVDVLVWRLNADLGMIDRFYKERSTEPGAYWYELDAKVKLLGHSEECLAFATLREVATLTPAQQKRRRGAVATLRRMLEDVETHNLAEARDIERELFRQLIGDVCHARHGLTFA
jgi:hypothetical protein